MAPSRAMALPADLLDALREVDPSPLAPKAVLYVHLYQAAVRGVGGIARVGGPPGQTGTHNSGPLGRRHHRLKTHAGYRARQCGAGRYVWLSPHGLGFLVDHRGTRRISAKHARMILDAPPGVDIYPV